MAETTITRLWTSTW